MLISFTLILLGVFSNSASAYNAERGNVHVILGPLWSQTPVHKNGFNTMPDQGGLGLVILGDVSDKGSLQINTFFFSKVYFRNDGDLTLAEKVKLAHVSMGYRRWWQSFMSTSLLLFTSYPMGEVDVVRSDFTPPREFKTTARENSETGLELGIGFELARSGRYALMLEGNYSYSLTKNSDEIAEHYGALLGIRYFVQGREKNPNF